MTVEQILLLIAAIVLLLVVVISMWRQRDHVTNEARMRILGNAHTHREVTERMQSIADSLYCELGVTTATVLAYTTEHRSIHASSNIKPVPMMSEKEAHSLDDIVHEAVVATSSLPKDSFVSKLLTSYKISYLLPLDHHEKRIGYICLELPPKQKKLAPWQLRILTASQKDIANAVASAVSTFMIRSMNDILNQHVDQSAYSNSTAKKSLDELDVAKDEFVSMASHQLRTPLTSIKGYISMLLEGDAGELTPEQKKLLSEAFLSSEQMVSLIGDYLNVSRIQTGKFLIDVEEIDLAKIAKQEAKRLMVSAKTRDIKIDVNTPMGAVKVFGDEAKLRQVILNFIDNAIYYSPEKSTITVELTETNKDATLKITDQGIGVPPEEQSKLFKKFFRASNARKHRPDGNGIGLYLAKQIVDGHKGQIIFSSTPGQGSTFGFSLPKE